jgi:adenylate kinase family enzyme
MGMIGKRISVIGVSGSGKTTFAENLGQQLGYPHFELDALHWEPNWVEAPHDIFRARVAQVVSGESWIIDGNYSIVRDLVWSRADTIVWLDYSLPLILWRVIRRTISRIVTRKELWNGNRESARAAVGRDSIILWALSTYGRRRREFPELLKQPENAHLEIVHHFSPRETDRWLQFVSSMIKLPNRIEP